MKNFFRQKVVDILSRQSRILLAKYNPHVIAVTGNIGKTTTKDYVYHFLYFKYAQDVRASLKSQNSEFGVNLTILNCENGWNSPLRWLKIIISNYLQIIFSKKYPKILVLEVGADKPGDIKFITSIIKPEVVVLTAFQKNPTHGEFFLNIDQHINEKKVLVDKMKKDGVIIYNNNDEVMSRMAIEKQNSFPGIKLLSFGTEEYSNVKIIENNCYYNEDAKVLGQKIRYKLNFGSYHGELEFRLPGVLGEAHAYSLASAICISIINGLTKEDVINAAKNLEFSKSRMRLLTGINNSQIIDDSYNSSPKALENAIASVSRILVKGKKIAVIGHMAELGQKTRDAHIEAGEDLSRIFDLIVLVGRNNDMFLDGIRKSKFDLAKVFLSDNVHEAIKIVHDNKLINQDDLILVKGSQSARLEKFVVENLANSEDAKNVCRQEVEWKKR